MIADFNQLTPKVLCAKRVAVGAGTQTFAGVDLRDYVGGCKISIAHNELSGSGATSIVYSLLDSADNTTFAASSYLPAATTTTAASPLIEIALDSRNCARYLQLKALTSSTTATFDVAALLVGVKQIT